MARLFLARERMMVWIPTGCEGGRHAMTSPYREEQTWHEWQPNRETSRSCSGVVTRSPRLEM